MATGRRTLRAGESRIHPAWWTLIFIVAIVAVLVFVSALFTGSLTPYKSVTLVSDRIGLVMDPGNEVKLRGVVIGRVADIPVGNPPTTLKLDISPDQMKYLPANVEAEIEATTIFGTKYVEFVVPENPSAARLTQGAAVQVRNVATEVNTVFETVMEVLNRIDPAKLNGVLSALAQGLRGQGEAIGEATIAGNEVLRELNARSEIIREDFRALKGFSDTFDAAAQDLITVLDAASTTSTTIVDNAQQLDALLLNLSGLSTSGINLIGPSKDNLVRSINSLEPTTALLRKYDPTLTCTLVGGKNVIDFGFDDIAGGETGYSVILDVALLFGDDQYVYPDNLPKIGAKGGPGGKPSCGSLPDVAQNFPVRNLVTDTGWGTGTDIRPNPGIGFPGYNSFFPVTRPQPQPPTMNRIEGGGAIGPIPYPGAPPYGAPQYGPDGTPLYPGLPPAPPPMAPKDPGPRPGEEPFVVPFPAQTQPAPPPPIPPRPVSPGPYPPQP